ncbi:MAG: leucine-rich repeat domain-containing protein [Candidatus Hodarchaeota archaeon]
MREPFTSERIYSEVKHGKLNKSEAIELLISLIEGSNEAKVREKCLDVCKKLSLKTERIFKILENSLISDENPLVRSAAARAIFSNFLKDDLSSLKWAIQHEKSPIVLKTIFDFFKNINNQKFKFLNKELQKWVETFALTIGLVSDEAKFILDLEALFAKDGENYEINAETYNYYQSLTDDGEPWLEIKNKHITGLSLNFYNWSFVKENPEYVDYLLSLVHLNLFLSALKKLNININRIREVPESIGLLMSLERLNLSRNKIRNLPKSIGSLCSLKTLDLSRNNIQEIPQSVFKLTSLKWLDLSHNDIQEIPESIVNLASLTILRLNRNNIKDIPDSIKPFLNSLEYFSY